ncbi:alpha/beta hydrolase [Roseofilum casamattae]|uniref:Alpha/beta hydrolase n=1 Tax=Roseofilum casamattae BLCC-M143 TaxID=3022442 RepID=A0ABT7BYF9_9CYAN|nr:alpha/beta hydrolase [Roseofilum casamattae]MDJ1183544.1 alpha/beta hydrolase [Roseofilum casamattae BLCC-M143]
MLILGLFNGIRDRHQLRRHLIGDFTLKRFLKSAVFIYLFFAAYVFVAADSLIFLPPASSYTDTADIIKIASSEQAQISARYLPADNSPYTILFSHGNAEDLGTIAPILVTLRSLGLSVFAYDYQGYGTSSGKPSERAAYADINAAYTYLTQTLEIPPEQIIVYGRSVGGGPSTYLATREPIAGLILESTFTSAFRTVVPVPILPFDKFPNRRNLQKFPGPVLIIHGTEDESIPFTHGEQLLSLAPGPTQFLFVEDAGHNDVQWVAGDRYLVALQSFIKLVQQTPQYR